MVGAVAVGLAAGMDQRYRIAVGIVSFLGLYQGAVALAGRALFDADQRFAPALWLPAPWWWIACLSVSAVALALVAVLDGARRRSLEPAAAPPPTGAAARAAASPPPPADDRAQGYDAVSAVVFLVGLYNGLAPFASRLLFDGDLLLALPLRLGAPWWWITSLAVLVATFVLLTLLDQAKDRALATADADDADDG
jgi:hypothetical protein